MEPAQPPYSVFVQEWLDRIMPPGMAPLALFRTLARDERLFGKFMSGGLLDRGRLSLRQREIIIHRTTALCGADYEWGVHAAVFAGKAGLDARQLHSLASGTRCDEIWHPVEAGLIGLCDELHASSTISDALWAEIRTGLTPEAILEAIMLAGFYHTVSYLSNGLRLTLEDGTQPISAFADGIGNG